MTTPPVQRPENNPCVFLIVSKAAGLSKHFSDMHKVSFGTFAVTPRPQQSLTPKAIHRDIQECLPYEQALESFEGVRGS